MFYNQPIAHRFGTDLVALLSSGEWNELDIAVAWIRESGLRHLRDSLEGFLKNKGKLRVVVGIDLDNTSKEGLAALLALEAFGSASTYINHNESGSVFHPKVYLFRKAGAARLIVGSNNITEAGLFRNTEAGLQISCKSDDQVIVDAVSAIDDWCDSSSGLARRLDPALLQQLEEIGYVSSEKALSQAAALRRAAARKPGSSPLFKSVSISAPTLPNTGTPPPAKKSVAGTNKAILKQAPSVTTNKSSSGSVLIMRIRTARGTQTQMPMSVVDSSFFKGQTQVQSLHDGAKRGIHVAHSAGKPNTLKLEIPETALMHDPMIRFERTPTGIQYQVWDKNTPGGNAIWSSLNAGLLTLPPSTFLTKPGTPASSTWWRFI